MTTKQTIILVLCLSAAKIILTNIFASNGMEIYSLEKNISVIEKGNKLLNKEIAQLSSLNRISTEAQKIGFNYSGTIANLTSEIPIALR